MVTVPFEKESLPSPPKSSERKPKPMLSGIVLEGEQNMLCQLDCYSFFPLKKINLGQLESQG